MLLRFSLFLLALILCLFTAIPQLRPKRIELAAKTLELVLFVLELMPMKPALLLMSIDMGTHSVTPDSDLCLETQHCLLSFCH